MSTMGVTSVNRVGRLPLYRWRTVADGKVVARGVAPTESMAWSASIKRAARASSESPPPDAA